jgi:multiple sugar transport system ATP-binding protein
MIHHDGLILSGLSKAFGDNQALNEINFDVAPGEVVAVTGPSGAGKSTLCKCIAGLERPDAGSITLGGREIAGDPPGKRGVAFLFESYALYPHKTVFENAASPLRVPGRNSSLSGMELAGRIENELDRLAIGHLAERLPSELSGGQKQRAALARALVQDSAAITMLDEPISHLDAKLRHRLRGEIKRELMARDAPAIWVTPDGLEALSVGDRVAVLIGGKIAQFGTPREIWENPASVEVARLIGDPPMNLLSARLQDRDGTVTAELDDGMRLHLPPDSVERLVDAAGTEGLRDGTVTIGVKPRDIRIIRSEDGEAMTSEVVSLEPFGKHSLVTLSLGQSFIRAKARDDMGLRAGEHVGLSFAGPITFFQAKTGIRIVTGWEEQGGETERRAVPAL